MRAACAPALLLACCAWLACCQPGPAADPTPPVASVARGLDPPARASLWDEPIRFSTKARDACTMAVSSHGRLTKLRVTCKGKGRSYWCEYLGRPDACRPYATNPRHYFTQIMWDMRKLQQACQGPRSYKPKMCLTGPAEAQLVFHKSWPKADATGKTLTPAKVPKPAKPAVSKPSVSKPTVSKPAPAQNPVRSTVLPPTEVAETTAIKLAQEYCWESLQGACAYIIRWFQN